LASVEGAAIEIESGSKIFMVANDAILSVDGRCFVHWFGADVCVTVPASVQVLSCEWFGDCDKLAIVAFEPGSMLRRIERHVLCCCGSLVAISIPARVEILCSRLCYGSALSSVIIPRKD
jgi:hypothetical protein